MRGRAALECKRSLRAPRKALSGVSWRLVRGGVAFIQVTRSPCYKARWAHASSSAGSGPCTHRSGRKGPLKQSTHLQPPSWAACGGLAPTLTPTLPPDPKPNRILIGAPTLVGETRGLGGESLFVRMGSNGEPEAKSTRPSVNLRGWGQGEGRQGGGSAAPGRGEGWWMGQWGG